MSEELKAAEAVAEPIIVYGRPTCPSVPSVLRLLDEAGVAYQYVDVRQDYEAAARLRQITGGYESVPTLVFPDGRALIEPGTLALEKALRRAALPGGRPVSTAAVVRAALSNPVYLILVLIGLALLAAVWLAG